MSNIRERLLSSINDNSLLETIYELHLESRDDRTVVGKELAILHNQGHLNAITEFIKLTQESFGHKFFTIRQELDTALPEINSLVLDVMQCVKHLTKEAGQDMSAGMLFSSFTAYCQANDDRPNAVLGLAIEQPDYWKEFISAAIIAGSRRNLSAYVDRAIELTEINNTEISSCAVFALGRIDYGGHVDLVTKSLEALKLVVQNESNDQLFSAVLSASYSLYLADETKEQDVSDLISVTLEQQGDLVLYSASQLFVFEKNTLPGSIVDNLLSAFENVKPKHTGALDNIDYGLEYLLEKGQVEKVINLLEILLTKYRSELSISQFDSLGRALVKNKINILNKAVTRWLMSGVVWLGHSAFDLINDYGSKKTIISADLNQLKDKEDGTNLFLVKKACGWFFMNPISAVSFIISLIDTASDDEVKSISEILFNPLLISYSGSVKEYLQNIPDDSSKRVKDVVTQLLSELDNYHDGLKSVSDLKELEPSAAQREAYHRKINREISEGYKKAKKRSFFSDFFGKPIVLLYGSSSIHYIHHGTDGEKTRQEMPLQRISTSIEFPSLENLAPQELEMKLRNFKLEGCTS